MFNTHFAESSHLRHSLPQKYASQSTKRLQRWTRCYYDRAKLLLHLLLNPKTMKYDRANVVTIDLVALYYDQYPQLSNCLPLKLFKNER